MKGDTADQRTSAEKLEDLFSALARESLTEEPVMVEDDIYLSISYLLNKAFMDVYGQRETSSILDETLDLLRKAAGLLLHLRLAKIVKRMASDGTPTALTSEESIVATRVEEAANLAQLILDSISEGNTLTLALLRGSPHLARYTAVYVKSRTPEFYGMDLKIYGPFREGDVAVIPVDNARTLTLNNQGKEVTVIG